jgi:ABC-type transport system involved in cytochrome bd biosynthesis fused ATPase/permease subunit
MLKFEPMTPVHLHSRRDMPDYAFKLRRDVEVDMPDPAPIWKLPEPVPLRTRGPLIQMESVSFAYPEASRDVLRDITLCIEQVSFP